MAMMAAFKFKPAAKAVEHVVWEAGSEAVYSASKRLGKIGSTPEGRVGLETRLRTSLDRPASLMSFTADERKELTIRTVGRKIKKEPRTMRQKSANASMVEEWHTLYPPTSIQIIRQNRLLLAKIIKRKVFRKVSVSFWVSRWLREGISMKDKQGNPINQDGSLYLEKVENVQEIGDDDFNGNIGRNIELPRVSNHLSSVVPINSITVIIKSKVFKKVKNGHSELSADQSRAVIEKALYSTDIAINDKPTSKPNYWILVNVGGHNALLNIDTDPKKANVEIVGWRSVRNESLEQIKNRAKRDGGQIIITREGAAGLSALTDGEVSGNKGNTLIPLKQGQGVESRSQREADGVISKNGGKKTSLLGVVRDLYTKGKEYTAKLYECSFFDVVKYKKSSQLLYL